MIAAIVFVSPPQWRGNAGVNQRLGKVLTLLIRTEDRSRKAVGSVQIWIRRFSDQDRAIIHLRVASSKRIASFLGLNDERRIIAGRFDGTCLAPLCHHPNCIVGCHEWSLPRTTEGILKRPSRSSARLKTYTLNRSIPEVSLEASVPKRTIHPSMAETIRSTSSRTFVT
jgi:hypothetical protein